VFAVSMLTVGRWVLHRILPWFQAHLSWPAGVLGMAITLALLFGAFAEWIGIHAIFGSFLVGIALGDSPHLRERTRATLDQFISTVFAPLFFASIGLTVNFVENFALVPVVLVLLIATLGKVLGCTYGAVLAGMNRQEAWAVGFGMNARGAMEIILGLLALEYGVIDQKMFVALVIMALVTSMTSGTLMQRMLKRQKSVDFTDLLSARSFARSLRAKDRREAIREMASVLASGTALDPLKIDEAVWARELTMPTGMGHGIAIPHARIEGLSTPLIAVGISRDGIDFDSPDGNTAHILFLILTPMQDNGAQLQILAGIARMASDKNLSERLVESTGFTEFLASLRAKEPEARPHK
jgi:mannitol/fructose-specific phosphotransferase system IIA component (Ntr-type)